MMKKKNLCPSGRFIIIIIIIIIILQLLLLRTIKPTIILFLYAVGNYNKV
jgi:uncharacterized protein (DUF983 family)